MGFNSEFKGLKKTTHLKNKKLRCVIPVVLVQKQRIFVYYTMKSNTTIFQLVVQ